MANLFSRMETYIAVILRETSSKGKDCIAGLLENHTMATLKKGIKKVGVSNFSRMETATKENTRTISVMAKAITDERNALSTKTASKTFV